ncbi:MAG: DctP family TRAP transporter solute-binding subunit [Oscillospiraceae bacterium]|nr:DctP family TRAP transporter solute-binding subunit [Oscillospiraceae bacterium]
MKQWFSTKRLIALLLAVVMVGTLAACGGGGGGGGGGTAGGGGGGGGAAQRIELNVPHINAPSHPVHLGLLLFADELYERSGGTMIAHIFDSAVLGGDISIIQQVNANQLPAGLVMGVCMWDGWDGRANLELLPFLFENYAEAFAAFDGELGRWSAEHIIEPHGGVVINYWLNGLRNFTNSVRPLYYPEDLQGMMFRTPQVQISMDMFEALGAAAITMAFAEVYTALQQGTMDGQCNSLAMIYTSRFYEVNHYVSLSHHQWATGVLMFSTEMWASLNDEQRGWVQEAAAIGARFAQQTTLEYEQIWIDLIIENGNSVNHINVPAFREAVVPVWEHWLAEYGTEFIDVAAPYTGPDSLANRFTTR